MDLSKWRVFCWFNLLVRVITGSQSPKGKTSFTASVDYGDVHGNIMCMVTCSLEKYSPTKLHGVTQDTVSKLVYLCYHWQ